MGDERIVRERLIHIHACQGIGWKTIFKLLAYDASLQSIYEMSEVKLASTFSMKKDHAAHFYKDLHETTFSDWFRIYAEKGIHVVTRFDKEYSSVLAEIIDPPWVLYCKGDVSILRESHMLSVVGTRNPSKTGFQALKKLLDPLIEQRWGVVSGLANGVDSAAHRLSLRSRTIAVLGSGIDHIYPSSARILADEIAKNHLLISEYPPSAKAQPWRFPHRNRVISGLTRGTLVIEAKERSGSLITADQALEQGREVFAVPGSIMEPRSVGTNRLIQQGARLVLRAEDILDEWPLFDK